MEKDYLEKIYRETFDGLALLYRDTELPEALIEKYYAGQIIMERAFVDMSYMGGGLASNLRYLIATADARDFSEAAPDLLKYGFVILNRGSFFKVVDIYRVGDKTQVLLLNVPGHAIQVFQSIHFPLEADLVQKAREDFDTKLRSEPLSVLQEPEWRDRTAFPIGMSDEGEFFIIP